MASMDYDRKQTSTYLKLGSASISSRDGKTYLTLEVELEDAVDSLAKMDTDDVMLRPVRRSKEELQLGKSMCTRRFNRQTNQIECVEHGKCVCNRYLGEGGFDIICVCEH